VVRPLADVDAVDRVEHALRGLSAQLLEVRVDAVMTGYPTDGLIRVTITDDTPGQWTLGLRVPEWAAGARVRAASGDGVHETDAAPGRHEITREFRIGDVVELELPMAPRVTTPDPHVDAVRGCVAIERGPEVFALESIDLTPLGVEDVGEVVIMPEAPIEGSSGRVFARFRARGAARG
jgi:DUF1680 family protein